MALGGRFTSEAWLVLRGEEKVLIPDSDSTGIAARILRKLGLGQKAEVTPLERVLADIRRALRTRNYYAAFVVALTVPEICTALTMKRSEFVKERHYVAWVTKYLWLGHPGIGMRPEDCWRLRGGVVHRANFAGHPHARYHRLVLSVRRPGVHATFVTVGDQTTAYVGLHEFCAEMERGALRWLAEHVDDPQVGENMRSLVRYRPNGVPAFVGRGRIKPAIA